MKPIIVLDTTLRDGEQMPGVSLNLSEKLEIARQLESLGVDYIEAGFPASSPGDFQSVRAIAGAVRECGVAALCRCVRSDIDRAWEALSCAARPRLHLVIASSPVHMEYKLRMEPEEVLERAVDCVRYARSLCGDVQFSCEDATRSDWEFLTRLCAAAIDAGATTINIPDTVGYSMTEEYARLMVYIQENTPNIENVVLSAHCHDDLGLAVANTLAAIDAGARQVECTVNGLGERAGNAALEEIVMGIKTRADYFGEVTTRIVTRRIARTSRLVATMTGVEVQKNKAIVGANAFAHESGIHQHGMLANRQTYEIISPEEIGLSQSELVLGKHSGRHAFAERLLELGYSVTEEEMEDAFRRFKELADKKKNISDRELEKLIGHELADVPEAFQLESFQLQSGNRIKSLAGVTLKREGREDTEAAMGDGPISAAYNAVARVVGGTWPLVDYSIRAVTEGDDALGEVTVRVAAGPKIFTGKGLSPDIIEASLRAYINAINRALAEV